MPINILVKLTLKDMKTVVLFKLVKSVSCGNEHDFEVFSARRLPTIIFWGTSRKKPWTWRIAKETRIWAQKAAKRSTVLSTKDSNEKVRTANKTIGSFEAWRIAGFLAQFGARRIALWFCTKDCTILNTIWCTKDCTICCTKDCTILSTIWCTKESTIFGTKDCTILSTIWCTKDCTIFCTNDCTILSTIWCTKESTIFGTKDCTILSTIWCTKESTIFGTKDCTILSTIWCTKDCTIFGKKIEGSGLHFFLIRWCHFLCSILWFFNLFSLKKARKVAQKLARWFKEKNH